MKHDIVTLIGQNCITQDEGQKVYDMIHPELLAEYPVELNFAGVDILAAPFFNFAIGQLLRDIPLENLNRLLTVTNLQPVGQLVLQLVMKNSKQYYSDESFRKALDTIVSEQAITL